MKQLFQNILITFSTSAIVCGALLNNVGAGVCFGIAAGVIHVLIIAKGINENDFL